MADEVTATVYLSKQLRPVLPDFMTQWKVLSSDDKDTLKKWAVEEGKALGIPIVYGLK